MPVSGVSKNRHNRFNTKQRKTNVMSDKKVTDGLKKLVDVANHDMEHRMHSMIDAVSEHVHARESCVLVCLSPVGVRISAMLKGTGQNLHGKIYDDLEAFIKELVEVRYAKELAAENSKALDDLGRALIESLTGGCAEAVDSPIGLPGHAWAESEAAMAAEPITEGGEA